eukprot:746360-Rhodomonas_salina.1
MCGCAGESRRCSSPTPCDNGGAGNAHKQHDMSLVHAAGSRLNSLLSLRTTMRIKYSLSSRLDWMMLS